MSKNFYISDLHLFHKNVTMEGTNFDERPYVSLEDMHVDLVKNWNSVVTNEDHVYILGDLSWLENENSIQLISVLKGNKHLILGNHDRVRDLRFKQLFIEITNYKELNDNCNGKTYKLILFHYPIAFWNYQHHFSDENGNINIKNIHLYGHLHNTKEETYYQEFLEKLNKEYNIKCIAKNIGCMMPYMNFTPQTLQNILEKGE